VTDSSVVVVVVLTGVGAQPTKAAAPAISATPTAVRTRGVISIIVRLQNVRVVVIMIRIGQSEPAISGTQAVGSIARTDYRVFVVSVVVVRFVVTIGAAVTELPVVVVSSSTTSSCRAG